MNSNDRLFSENSINDYHKVGMYFRETLNLGWLYILFLIQLRQWWNNLVVWWMEDFELRPQSEHFEYVFIALNLRKYRKVFQKVKYNKHTMKYNRSIWGQYKFILRGEIRKAMCIGETYLYLKHLLKFGDVTYSVKLRVFVLFHGSLFSFAKAHHAY